MTATMVTANSIQLSSPVWTSATLNISSAISTLSRTVAKVTLFVTGQLSEPIVHLREDTS